MADTPRTITEIHTFTQEQIEDVIKTAAKGQIIGSFFQGEFLWQEAKWHGENLSITTAYTRFDNR